MQHAGRELPVRPTRSRRAGLGRLEAVLLFVLLGGGWFCVASAFLPLVHGHRRAPRTKCANNMRQLALAAIQYADDKRFYPHVGPIKELDGGTTSNATTKTIRALVWFGYHDNPEGFICPDSYDLYVPIEHNDVKANMRLWFWAGAATGDPITAPFADGRPDPALDATDEVSYGWTRRGMNSNVRSTAPLLADRAQANLELREGAVDTTGIPIGVYGNHDAGSNVAQADGSVTFIAGATEGTERLSATVDPALDGFLGVRAPTREPKYSTQVRDLPGVELWLPLVALFGPPGLLALLLAVRVYRTPTEPGPMKVVLSPRGVVAPVRPSRVETLGPEERATLGLGKSPTAGSPVVLQHQQRCPICHDGVGIEHPLSRCLDCRAVFHAECVPPGGRCPTLGCGVRP